MTKLGRYDILWRLARPFLPLVLRYRAATGKEDVARIAERLGRLDARSDLPENPVWIHAVSVGESVAALALADSIRARDAGLPILITTNTVTAAARVAAQAAETGLTHLYQPLDHPDMVASFLRRVKPRLALFLESDFWPNLVIRTAGSGVPVAFVSAQLSDRAFSRWQKQRALASGLFGSASLVLAVDDTQAERFIALGADRPRVRVGGSLKLPGQARPTKPDLVAMLKTATGSRKVLLAASTHEGEDATVIEAARKLGEGWFTVIAPRHPERGGEIAALCDAHGLTAQRRGGGATAQAGDAIYIADTLGEMDSLFNVADIVFLGGSLKPLGGHNPVEPAAHGLPILTGPHVFKNAAEFSGLRDAGVVTEITNAEELASSARSIAEDAARRATIAAAASHYAAQTGKRPQIAADSCLELIGTSAAPS
ncbi:MAG: 3-deoxy-D-manno-octulosonic acid transferase [Pseudomonadota bacterium]|nr:3-deoxy-D-manno-octulosonic acid transferase [Pseudomonadota bacterium]